MKHFDKIGYRERIMAAFSLLTIAVIVILSIVISYSQQRLLNENLENRINLFSNIFQTIIYEQTGSLDFGFNSNLSSTLQSRNAMLNSIFHQRLYHQWRNEIILRMRINFKTGI